LALARGLIAVFGRLVVTGDVSRDLRDGGLILAANHVSPVDPIVLAAACRTRGLAPRFLATAGVFKAPVVGSLVRHAGHIRVDRGTASAADAVSHAARALAERSTVLIYPEGRIGLAPGMWPERGKTGTARLALATGAPVIPVAVWGAHEVVNYAAPRGMWPVLWRALRRRPVVRVHFGSAVDLSRVSAGEPGAAAEVTDLIIEAITRELRALRVDEPDEPRHVDVTRPVETRRAQRR
jgi:1-acyl-sn-glycerol-3-phosphate acyltransferase